MTNIRLFFLNVTSSKKKLVLKQSYLLLTWAHYLLRSSGTKGFRKPNISIRPIKQSKFTNIKAPMAHKTFSQEQYWFRFYKLQINFKMRKPKLGILNSVNTSFYIILLLRSSLPLLETNLMLLKVYSFTVPVRDVNFLLLKSLKASTKNS